MIKFMRPTLPAPSEWTPYLLRHSYPQNRFSNNGPCVEILEIALSVKFPCPGRSYILCASATTGLAAVLMATGMKSVAYPAFTFPATLQAIRMAGCQPIVCDVGAFTWEIIGIPDVEEACLAVLAVRPFGLCRNQDKLDKQYANLIFDSAAAFGGQFDEGSFVGSQGIAEVFSFHATKVFGIGEGGLICCDSAWEPKIREALNFGICGEHIHRGLNGKMSEFSAAVGLAVLDGIDASIAHRRVIAEQYREALELLEVTMPFMPGNPVWQTYPILLNEDAGSFVEKCLEMGVEVRRYYRPSLSGNNGVSADLSRRMVCLPVYSDMTVEEQSQVIRVVTECLC